MTKELFIETIEALRKQYEHDEKCSEAFRVILPNDHISNYDNHWLTNQLIKLLQIPFNDDHKDSWIEYYINEINFGKLYYEGCARYKNGSNIDLSDAGKLYDFLMSEKDKK